MTKVQESLRRTSVPEAKIEEFKKWLYDTQNADILAPTNEWEVLRFRCNNELGIVYINAKQKSSFVGEAVAQWNLFKQSDAF